MDIFDENKKMPATGNGEIAQKRRHRQRYNRPGGTTDYVDATDPGGTADYVDAADPGGTTDSCAPTDSGITTTPDRQERLPIISTEPSRTPLIKKTGVIAVVFIMIYAAEKSIFADIYEFNAKFKAEIICLYIYIFCPLSVLFTESRDDTIYSDQEKTQSEKTD